MGHLLDALKQIEDRAPAPRPPKPTTVESSAPVEPSPQVESAPRVESSSPIESLAAIEAAFEAVEQPCAAESVFTVLGDPCAVEDAFAVAERPIAGSAMPAPPLGESHANHANRGATVPVDPRYRELLGAILARMNVQGDTSLLMAGMAEDEPRAGQLAAFYPLLASRVEGGILVVDADERNAGATRLLGLTPKIGLRDVLAGNASWQDAIRETRHPDLFVLPEVPDPADPTPLDPADLSRLLGVLRESYHLVVVDAVPPTPRAAARWSIVCDAAVLAIRLGVASRRRVQKTLDALAARGTDVLGCVLLEP